MGTQEKWNTIQGSVNVYIPSGYIIHCTNGDISIQ